MRIFFLDEQPKVLVTYLKEAHVLSSILIAEFILKRTQNKFNLIRNSNKYFSKNDNLYKCICQSKEEYTWMLELYEFLIAEKLYRWGGSHKSELLIPILSVVPKLMTNNVGGLTLPNKKEERKEYVRYKDSANLSWKKRNKPEWFN